MKPLKEYRIPFLGLKRGTHEYDFTLTDKFFEVFENSEISQADIAARIVLEKQLTIMTATISLEGKVVVPCDRCGDDMGLKIKAEPVLIIKFGEETKDTGDDVLILGPQEYELDMAQYLYEYAHLAMPARHVHPNPDDCNQEVVKAFEKYKVETTSDTKWADLKNLNFEDPEDQEFVDEEE